MSFVQLKTKFSHVLLFFPVFYIKSKTISCKFFYHDDFTDLFLQFRMLYEFLSTNWTFYTLNHYIHIKKELIEIFSHRSNPLASWSFSVSSRYVYGSSCFANPLSILIRYIECRCAFSMSSVSIGGFL